MCQILHKNSLNFSNFKFTLDLFKHREVNKLDEEALFHNAEHYE